MSATEPEMSGKVDSRSSRAPARAPEGSRGSNPLDWPHIDRTILLGALVLLSPVGFGGGLAAMFVVFPDWFDARVTMFLLLAYATIGIALVAFILAALRRRQRQSVWPLMENFVFGSYIGLTLVESWLSGTHFTAGLLLIFVGLAVTMPLASLQKVKVAYVTTCLAMVAFSFMERSGAFRYAPLFVRPPLRADGAPVTGWFAFEVLLALVLLAILYIGLVATERWANREQRYRELSTVDGLTGLSNRRSFLLRVENELFRARRAPSTYISCIMLDVDNFKAINDTYGHAVGDAVLVQVAAVLQDNARRNDEVGRYGGEEFTILLPATPPEGAVQLAERLREKLALARVVAGDVVVSVTASFGVAAYLAGNLQQVSQLLRAADTALYSAKHAGRNRVVAADTSLDDDVGAG